MGRRPRTGGIHRRNPRSAEYRKSIGCDLLKWKSRDWISKRRHGISEIHFNLSSDAGLNNTSQQAPGRFPPHVFQSQPITSVAQVTDIHILLLNMYNSAYALQMRCMGSHAQFLWHSPSEISPCEVQHSRARLLLHCSSKCHVLSLVQQRYCSTIIRNLNCHNFKL